jgi:hypothetical protein
MSPNKYGDRVAVDVGGGEKPVEIQVAPSDKALAGIFEIEKELKAVNE